MTSTLTKPIDAVWLRRVLRVFIVIAGAFILYVLSFGPVLWLCSATPSTGWGGLPVVVRMFYGPLAHVPEPIAGVVDHYAQFWIGVE